jgi:hypothetical protein
MCRRGTIAATGCLLSLLSLVSADEPKPADKTPLLLVAAPLGISPGAAVRFTGRGLNLDQASEVRATIGDKKLDVKLHGKQKVGVPQNQELKKFGDCQVDFELTVPTEGSPEKLSLVVVTPQGESKPYELPITAATTLVSEKEPNDGFDQPQPIELDKIILGRIESAQNVDVYAISGQAGQKLLVEIIAERLGSTLDCQLSLHNARGVLLASNDDQPNSADPQIKIVLPGTGQFFVVISDANDQGSPTHGYRLSVRAWDGK